MFFNAPGKPSKVKEVVYLLAATILGVLLSALVHILIEIYYLHLAFREGREVNFYGNCALPPVVTIALLLLGVVGGFLLGRFWWQKVYIERSWAKRYSFRK